MARQPLQWASMAHLDSILTTVLTGMVTAGLISLPVAAHAASCPDRTPIRTAQFEPAKPTTSTLPPWQPMALPTLPARTGFVQTNKAPGILAPIGAIGAGTVLPSVLFINEINQGYEQRRAALEQHPAEFEAKFYGMALVYSTLSVSLAPAGAGLFYIIGGGPVLRALGGFAFGLVFAVIAIPIGFLTAMALTSSYQNNEEAKPNAVYTTWALSMYGTITAGSLVGFFLIGKRKKDGKPKASVGVAPTWDGHQNRWIPTLSGRF
jgi:hypothetical protein